MLPSRRRFSPNSHNQESPDGPRSINLFQHISKRIEKLVRIAPRKHERRPYLQDVGAGAGGADQNLAFAQSIDNLCCPQWRTGLRCTIGDQFHANEKTSATDVPDDGVFADRAGDPELSFRYNRDFHFTLYRLSGMEMLVAHIESLWVSMGPMLTVYYREGEHKYVGGSEHERAIEGLREKDSEKARAAMEQDLILGGEDFLRFLQAHEGFVAD